MYKKNITLGAIALGLALLPAVSFAQNGPKIKAVTKPVITSASSVKPVINKEALAAGAITCIQTAVNKREDAISAAFTTYSQAVIGALTARKTALNNSWSKATNKERLAARNVAWDAYKKTVKDANAKMMSTKKAAHGTFAKDAKACKVSVTGEDKRADLI